MLEHRRDGGLAAITLRDVKMGGEGLAACSGQAIECRVEFFSVGEAIGGMLPSDQITDRDPSAGAGEDFGNAGADATSTSGDEGNFSFQGFLAQSGNLGGGCGGRVVPRDRRDRQSVVASKGCWLCPGELRPKRRSSSSD
jgi:hypothetical protein